MSSRNISFFIPAYNCAGTIKEAVESIMATNFSAGDELMVVDDCSVDDTASVLEQLKVIYSHLIVIPHKRNKGGAAARNTAVENSKNELLFCLDSDNVLHAHSIARLKEYMLQSGADVASFQQQHFFISDKSKPEYTWTLPDGEFPQNGYLNGLNTPGQHGNYLFTKESWVKAHGYAEGTGALDTWSFGLRQAITGAKQVVLKDSFYYHRLSDHSYWMRDNEKHLWSVSIKATYALFPFFDRIDEGFLNYMLGQGKYIWFYNLKKRPLKLVEPGVKNEFYNNLNLRTRDFVYPKPGLFKRAVNKLKRMIRLKK